MLTDSLILILRSSTNRIARANHVRNDVHLVMPQIPGATPNPGFRIHSEPMVNTWRLLTNRFLEGVKIRVKIPAHSCAFQRIQNAQPPTSVVPNPYRQLPIRFPDHVKKVITTGFGSSPGRGGVMPEESDAR